MGLFDGIIKTVADVAGTATTGVPWGSIISGGASLIGGAMTNSANQAQAQANRDFQAGQSATSYQRAVADMQAAGLSPMLAYSQGGASTPSGSTATMVNPVPEATKAFESNRLNTQELQNMKATEELTKAQKIQSIAQAQQAASQAAKNANDIDISLAMLPYNIASAIGGARLNNASASNQEKGIAPSADPYWYRDAKKVVPSILQNVVPSPSAVVNSKAIGILFPGMETLMKGKK